MAMLNLGKKSQKKATKNLLDIIVLHLLEEKSMFGYEIMLTVKKNYDYCIGASTIYPLLNKLEKDRLLKSEWNMETKRPRKQYELTRDGRAFLHCFTDSLTQICKILGVQQAEETSSRELIISD